jgi:hypothetical protein
MNTIELKLWLRAGGKESGVFRSSQMSKKSESSMTSIAGQ